MQFLTACCLLLQAINRDRAEYKTNVMYAQGYLPLPLYLGNTMP